MRKSPPSKGWQVMDNEKVNEIGTLLADLTARTDALRGYL